MYTYNILFILFILCIGNTEEIEIFEEFSNGERHKKKLKISAPANTSGLKDKFIKTIYNSLLKYWSMQTSVLGFLASVLDPRFKNLRFAPEQRDAIYWILYNNIQLLQSSNQRSMAVSIHQDPSQKTIFDDLFEDIPGQQEDNELDRYLNMSNVPSNVDPLSWWKEMRWTTNTCNIGK